VGHSFGADIAMYFSLLYPERVAKLVALEPGLAALVHLRNDKDWIGWAAWVAKLEEVGIHVPEDKRTDAEFLLQLSLETPKFYGPARGLPRNREPLLHLIRNTTLLKDYEVVGAMTLDAVRTIKRPRCWSTAAIRTSSARMISCTKRCPTASRCCCRAASISARWNSRNCSPSTSSSF
jgi:pimeloyl-ACP methyl ester carboxylesterase